MPNSQSDPSPLPLLDARLLVDKYRTGWGSPDFTVPADHIHKVEVSEKADQPASTGRIDLRNEDYRYTTGVEDSQIHIGDRVVFQIRTQNAPGTSRSVIGQGAAGSMPVGSGAAGNWKRVGTYEIIDENPIEQPGGLHDLTLDLADAVFHRLRNLIYFAAPGPLPASGTEDAFLNRALREKAPTLDRAALPLVNETVHMHPSGVSLDSMVAEMAGRLRDRLGPISLASEGLTLRFDPVDDLDPVYPTPLPHDAFGLAASESMTDDMVNRAYMSGGFDDTGNVSDSQETVDEYETVTDTNRVAIRANSVKSDISKAEIWTYSPEGSTTSEGGVRLRFQEDQNGAPIDIDDTKKDLGGRTLKVALDPNGWTLFELQEIDIPERRPWLILDSTNESGHDVGGTLDATGNFIPAYRTYYPKPLLLDRLAPRARELYPPYEDHVRNETLTSSEAINERARAELATAFPRRQLGPLRALSLEAHALRAGDLLPVHYPGLRAVGEYLVTERKTTYENISITTDISLTGTTETDQ
jgi:hypothetical protein